MEDAKTNKWLYNLEGGEVWMGAEYDTREQAIEEAEKEIKEYGYEIKSFEIGQSEKVEVCGIDVDCILENVAENTTNDVSEVGDDYLCYVKDEDKLELEEKLNDVFFEWIKKHGYEPDFFKIVNIEKITL